MVANPDEPTHVRVLLLVGRVRAHHADDRYVQSPCRLDMQRLPPGNRHGAVFGIFAFPMPIEVATRRFIVSDGSTCLSLARRCIDTRTRASRIPAPACGWCSVVTTSSRLASGPKPPGQASCPSSRAAEPEGRSNCWESAARRPPSRTASQRSLPCRTGADYAPAARFDPQR